MLGVFYHEVGQVDNLSHELLVSEDAVGLKPAAKPLQGFPLRETGLVVLPAHQKCSIMVDDLSPAWKGAQMTTTCPKCSHYNPAEVRFCLQCATELTQPCTGCDFVNPGGVRFCGNCGQLLSSLSPTSIPNQRVLRHMHSYVPKYLLDKIVRTRRSLQGEKRNVTILSTDIAGFTMLTHRLAPEEIYDIINKCLRIQVEEIYRHEGMVDKFTGDGLQAVFGAPLAHENDAERAIRAALSAQRTLAQFNADLAARTGMSLEVRMGLHTGPVVIGGLGSDLHMEYTAVGDAINIASWVERIAPPSSILVSSRVYWQTETLFRFRKLDAILIKGQEVYEVLGLAQRVRRRAWMGDQPTPLVGRQAELAQLQRLADRVVEEGQGQIVAISAEAGCGKTRLIEEVKPYLRSKGFAILENDSFSYTQGMSYPAFLGLLRGDFDLPQNGEARNTEKVWGAQAVDARSLRDILTSCLVSLESGSIVENSGGSLAEKLSPAELRQRTFLAIRDLFVDTTGRSPVAIVMEDFQEMDQSSLDLLSFLLGLTECAPVLFCCLTRSEENGQHQQLCQTAARAYPSCYHELRLEPLSQDESCDLVARLLRLPDLPADLERAVLDRGGGNPLFIIETLSDLIDQGLIYREDDRWQPATDIAWQELGVPRSLQGLILARFDGLEDRLRYLLQCASVLGTAFSTNILSDIVDSEHNVVAGLEELVHRGVLLRTSNGKSPTYAFRHVYAQETIYDTLLATTCRTLHRKAGQALEALAGDADERLELLAYHYARSDAPEKGLKYLTLAGKGQPAVTPPKKQRGIIARTIAFWKRRWPSAWLL